jgi:hypothetical protein
LDPTSTTSLAPITLATTSTTSVTIATTRSVTHVARGIVITISH